MPTTSIELAENVTKQIITLASGIVTILVTVFGYLYEYFKVQPLLVKGGILLSTVALLASIVAGIFEYGALISEVQEKGQKANVWARTLRTYAKIQWTLFLLGIAGLLATLCFIMILP